MSITWETLRDGLLSSAGSTAQVAATLMLLAQEVQSEGWKHGWVADALGDDPTVLALLHRNARAHELMASALKDLRSAIMAASAAAKARGA